MAKKHQIKVSSSSGCSASGRKWRRQNKQFLKDFHILKKYY